MSPAKVARSLSNEQLIEGLRTIVDQLSQKTHPATIATLHEAMRRLRSAEDPNDVALSTNYN